MKIVIPGGTGQVGSILDRAFTAAGHEVVLLTRRPTNAREVRWDGVAPGPWCAEIDGSDVVVNLAGRSVNCRYTEENLRSMMDSRVLSARAVGRAIATAGRPPRVWLQMSTATIYAHRFDAANDEATGLIGGTEPGAPGYWGFSVDIAQAWEKEQQGAETPHTRKVALRSAIVMSPDRGGAFDYLRWMARLGLGGPIAGGRQYVSWIHDQDFVRAVEFIIDRDQLVGPVNVAAPEPVPQRSFMRTLRRAWGMPPVPRDRDLFAPNNPGQNLRKSPVTVPIARSGSLLRAQKRNWHTSVRSRWRWHRAEQADHVHGRERRPPVPLAKRPPGLRPDGRPDQLLRFVPGRRGVAGHFGPSRGAELDVVIEEARVQQVRVRRNQHPGTGQSTGAPPVLLGRLDPAVERPAEVLVQRRHVTGGQPPRPAPSRIHSPLIAPTRARQQHCMSS
jgi:uncharacterized protein